MSRTQLFGAASAVALTCLSAGAFAQEPPLAITGGGSTLAEFDYFNEFATFNAGQKKPGLAKFDNSQGPGAPTGNNALYWPAGSGSGQTAFLNDDLSCDANKVTGANGGNCSGTVGGNASVDYAASDATLSSTQIQSYASSPVGQAQAGNLIQLPSIGVGVSFPIVNPNFSANGQVALSDNDLCGIFSGKFTNWSQTSAASKLTGAITVVYRNDGSGTSFLLLNHFSAVCNSSNSSFPVLPVVPSTTFVSVFTNSTPPANFVGQKGSSGIANYLSGVGGAAPTSAIAYLSPDFTTIDPNSNAVLGDGSKSKLNVASVLNGQTPELPTVAAIAAGLNSAKIGSNLTPPKTAAGFANPTNLVPLIQVVKSGYPVVGYTTFDFAQCYASPAIATAIVTFLSKDHYNPKGAYATSIANNGFVALGKSGAKTFLAGIQANILANNNGFNDNIQNASACSGLVGR